jgi:hypothetical protein
MWCCLCLANSGDKRPGYTAEGQPLPLCPEHSASCREHAAKKQAKPLVVTVPRDPQSSYIDAVLNGRLPSLSEMVLGSIARGSDRVQ